MQDVIRTIKAHDLSREIGIEILKITVEEMEIALKHGPHSQLTPEAQEHFVNTLGDKLNALAQKEVEEMEKEAEKEIQKLMELANKVDIKE